MTSTKPYLIRAIYEWCSDQGFTPHLLVDTSIEGVVVPGHLVENDSIVLNIEASAVRSLEMGNEWLLFNARFSGKAMDIAVPVGAVRAIFARENGQGYAFEVDAEPLAEDSCETQTTDPTKDTGVAPAPPSSSKKAKDKKSHLKLV